ncbi:MAG: hypothetical protein ABR500_10005 [Dermatophilaceae bacterium]
MPTRLAATPRTPPDATREGASLVGAGDCAGALEEELPDEDRFDERELAVPESPCEAAGVWTGGGGAGFLTGVTEILPYAGTATGGTTAGAVSAGREAARETATSETRSLIEISAVEPSDGAADAGAADTGVAAAWPEALAGIANAATRPPEAARTAEVLMAGDVARDAMRVSSDKGL